MALTPELAAEFAAIRQMIAETDAHATEAVDIARRLRTELLGTDTDIDSAKAGDQDPKALVLKLAQHFNIDLD